MKEARHKISRDYVVDDAYSAWYGYDLAGNILTLDRRGRTDATLDQVATAQYDFIDRLVYSYRLDDQGNPTSQIQDIADNAVGTAQPFGFEPAVGTFGHDGAGNVTSDGQRGLTYNAFNFPSTITAPSVNGTMEMTYRTDGSVYTRRANDTTRYYLHNLLVEDDKIRSYQFPNGRVTFPAATEEDPDPRPRFQYTLKDHLGNTVVLFEDRDGDGFINSSLADPATAEVLQRELYYPFGLPLRGTTPLWPNPSQDYLYNGKEDVWEEWVAGLRVSAV